MAAESRPIQPELAEIRRLGAAACSFPGPLAKLTIL